MERVGEMRGMKADKDECVREEEEEEVGEKKWWRYEGGGGGGGAADTSRWRDYYATVETQVSC